jgi:hypothetical protein
LDKKLFTQWSQSTKPLTYVFTSLPYRVEGPADLNSIYQLISSNKKQVSDYEFEYRKRGYSVFLYEVYANASANLNDHLFTYSTENFCFIVFHELLHNYFMQQHIDIPYEVNEAASDIIGNYMTLNFAKINNQISYDSTLNMIHLNEKTYEIINKYVKLINEEIDAAEELCDKCNNEIYLLTKDYDTFQKDRFYHAVNTAFLLKNNYYSKYYFLVKKVYEKSKSVKEFIEILNKIPEDINDCEKYLKEYF